MKYVLPFLTLAVFSCSCVNSEPPVVQNNRPLRDKKMTPAPCSLVAYYVQSYDAEMWEKIILKIRNTYANVAKIIDDKESIDFSVAFLNGLSISEDLDQKSRGLYVIEEGYLPNTESLKFFYRAEKEVDNLLSSLNRFSTSRNNEIKQCASEVTAYLHAQKDFFIAIREIDYQSLELSQLSQAIPPEVLRAHAKLLEQRESMAQYLISFYESFAPTSSEKKFAMNLSRLSKDIVH